MINFNLSDEEFERFSQWLFSRGVTSFALVTAGSGGPEDTVSVQSVAPNCAADEPERLEAAMRNAMAVHKTSDFNFLDQRQPVRQPLDCVATESCKVSL